MTSRRAFDCALAAIGLAVTAVPLALSALAVRVGGGPGPVIYRQIRVGRGGRPFFLYKLRTMVAATDGPMFTRAGDARVTAVGRVLRRLKLDELPQLWNVLAGDMGIVGPRPEVPRFVERYTAAQRAILEATPGLAGRAALVYADEPSLLRDHADADDVYVRYLMPLKIEVDLEYERRRTLWSDVGLILEIALLIVGKSLREDRTLSIPPTTASPAAGSQMDSPP